MKNQKLLLFGGTGQIGSEFIRQFSNHFKITAPPSSKVDITNREIVEACIKAAKPDLILDAAGYTNTDGAKKEADKSFLLNCGSVLHIASIAAEKKIPLYYLSTEIVFNGKKTNKPYTENDSPDPLLTNAKTKRLGELATLDASSKNCVIRLIMCYSAYYPRKMDLARLVATKVGAGEEFIATKDQKVNPVYINHLISAIKTILDKHASGIYHVGAKDYTTPYEFAKKLARKLNLNDQLIKPTTFSKFSKTRPEPRPKHQWLDTKKFRRDFGPSILKTIDEGIEDFAADYISVNSR